MTPVETHHENRSSRPFWIAIGVLAVIALGLFLWKTVAENRAEGRLEEERTRWEAETRERVAQRTREVLLVAGQPLGLAVRDAAMDRNYGEIQAYLDRVVREPGVQRIAFAAGDSVTVATDRSLVGRALSAIAPRSAGASETTVERRDGAFQVVVPITGFNERLGVLVLDYAPEEPATGGRSSPGGPGGEAGDTVPPPSADTTGQPGRREP